ncbi:MAG: sel1 repeat family protein [Proteobacteria bacterium]|nr:sel1 repeat family protein [Pseudomonadota bacterium]
MTLIRRLALSGAMLAMLAVGASAQSIPLEGLSFAKKIKLARAGDDTAQLAIGMHYEAGDQAEKDVQQAARWYREATLKGNIEAQYRLAKLISKGGRGLTADKVAAVTLFQAGAEKGHAMSQNELGLRYQNGEGIDVDMVEAARWFQKAVDQGYAPAEVNLGLLRVRGQGVPRDYGIAINLFQDAAKRGDAWAMNNLGSMYEMGWGVAKDLQKAREYYRMALSKGNKMAQSNLARLEAAGTSTATIAPEPDLRSTAN